MDNTTSVPENIDESAAGETAASQGSPAENPDPSDQPDASASPDQSDHSDQSDRTSAGHSSHAARRQRKATARDAQSAEERHKKVAHILRFIVAPILGGLAIIGVVLAVLSATIWSPDPTARATTTARTRYIASDPGVLSLGNSSVKIDVTTPGDQQVCLAIGSASDVAGWLESREYTRVEGLTSWTELTGAVDEAADIDSEELETDPEKTLSLQDSDMWTATKCGEGSVSLTRGVTDDQAVIIDTNPAAAEAEDKGAAATVALTWERASVLNLAIPLGFISGLLLVAAVLCATLFASAPWQRRKKRIAAARDAGSDDTESDIDGVGLDSPRWARDHIETKRRAQVSSHRAEKAAKRRRKSTKNGEASEEATPQIVDVQNVNLVARQQEANTSDNPTTTISSDTMAAYFQRLAEEKLGSDDVETSTPPTEESSAKENDNND